MLETAPWYALGNPYGARGNIMPYGYLGKVRQFHAFVPAQVRASVYICVHVRVHFLVTQCCGPEIIFFRIQILPWPYFRIRIRLVYEKYIRNSDNLNIAKKPDCLEKFIWTADHLNIAEKLIFLICTFLQLCICQLETELNLDPDSNPDPELIMDPDSNLQIISDPAGSGCTTLLLSVCVNSNMTALYEYWCLT